MKFNDKIKQLLESGKITEEQAQDLERSTSSQELMGSTTAFHNTIPLGMLLTVLALVIGGGLLWTAAVSPGGGTETIQNVAQTLNQTGKVGEMNKSLSTLIGILLVIIPMVVFFTWLYNSLVAKEENVLASWAQVESSYQRRMDLVPNLAKAVRSYAEHEKNTLIDIARLRSHVESVEKQSSKVKEMAQGAAAHLNDDAYMAGLAKIQQNLGGEMKSLMVTVESYPVLRASDQFLELQAQLEGTENRINVARMAFNEKVNEFNGAIRQMPGSLVAGMGKFQRKAYFKAEEGASKSVSLDLGEGK